MWKIIPGFSKYQSSEDGFIKNINSSRILNARVFPDNSMSVKIQNDENIICNVKVHRLIATTFIPNIERYKYVVHKDRNKKNNSIENLEWSESAGKYRKPHQERKGRTVIQLDIDGKFIKRWASAAEAQKNLGITRGIIGDVCRCRYGSKTAGGFKWKFEDDIVEGEIWKDFENVKVSNMGRIRLKKGSISEGTEENGYRRIKINNKAYLVHVLIATCFIQKGENHYEVNHKDGNGFNNKVENLEWCTKKRNIQHAFEIGINKHTRPILVHKNGEFYKEFPSVSLCHRELGTSRNSILLQCNGSIKKPKIEYTFKYK